MHVGWRGMLQLRRNTQGRRGPQASCRINGTQGKTAASADSCTRSREEKKKGNTATESDLRCCKKSGAGEQAVLYKEPTDDLKRASRGGRRSGRKKRFESDTEARKCPRNGWWGFGAISGAECDRLPKRISLVG